MIFFVANKETGPEVNAGETKYMFMSHKQNAGQYVNSVNIGNKILKGWNSSNVWEQPK